MYLCLIFRQFVHKGHDTVDQLRDQYEQHDHDRCYKSYKSKKNGQSPSAAFQIFEQFSLVKFGQGIHQIGNDTPYGHRIKIGAYGLLDPCKLRQVCQDVKQDDADEQSDQVGVSSFKSGVFIFYLVWLFGYTKRYYSAI